PLFSKGVAFFCRFFLHDGKLILLAKIITCFTNVIKFVFSMRMIFLSVLEVHGIDDWVVVCMLFIGVRVNHGFMSWRDLISQFLANLLCLLWRSLLAPHGLYYVMRLNAAIFAP